MASRSYEESALAGQPWGRGARTFGYRRDGKTVVPEEAAVIREAALGILGGDSRYRWVGILAERGVLTTMGNPWSLTTLTRLLLNPHLSGRRVYKDEIVADGDWEAILTVKEQDDLARIFDERQQPDQSAAAGGNAVRKYLLTGGLACCGICGKPLQAKPASKDKRSYVCDPRAPISGCGKIRIAAEPLEDYIAVRVLGKLASKKVMAKLMAAAAAAEKTGKALADEIGDVRGRLSRLGEMWMRHEIGETAFKAAERQGEATLKDLRRQVQENAELEHLPLEHMATPEDLANWWENEATVQEQRDLVAVLVDEIKIEPSKRRGFKGLDEDRVTVIWNPKF